MDFSPEVMSLMTVYLDGALDRMEKRILKRVDEMEERMNARFDGLLATLVRHPSSPEQSSAREGRSGEVALSNDDQQSV